MIYVGSRSRHASCGGAAAAVLQGRGAVTLSAVGMHAISNAMTAAAHAAYYLAKEGLAVLVVPSAHQVAQPGGMGSVVCVHLACATG